jgi:hypothetical protein
LHADIKGEHYSVISYGSIELRSINRQILPKPYRHVVEPSRGDVDKIISSLGEALREVEEEKARV